MSDTASDITPAGGRAGEWPVKTRELHTEHFDSTIWNRFRFRPDDVVIATWAKAGTTWTQQIVTQLISNGAEGLPLADMCPWLDLRIIPEEVKLRALEAQTDRRCVKTHLPLDALVFSPEAKYLYVARDGRDALWSLHNHLYNATDGFYEAVNETPGRVGPRLERPTASPRDFFLEWLENDATFQPFWPHIRDWWAIRHLPNVKLLHFQDLKDDMAGETRAIADFLGITVDEEKWPEILEHCSFDYMRSHGESTVPAKGGLWKNGAETFFHKGSNGRWRDALGEDEIARYESLARAELGEECAAWLMHGKRATA